MNTFLLTYKQYGERSILIEWPSKIDKKIIEDVHFFKDKLEKLVFEEIIEIKSAYNSMLIIYKVVIENIYNEILSLKDIYSSNKSMCSKSSKLWKIPVCYDDKFALDLDQISLEKRLSKQNIVALHSQAIYTVYFIGFLPGFLYLGGLDKALNVPRKSTPRLQISKGAVAIGSNQTGIYPCESPGGWNIIGNSPIEFFEINKKTPCFANPGDQIQFSPITLKRHGDILTLVQAGVYQLESEVIIG